MNSRVKTYPVLSQEPVMRLGRSTATVFVTVILLGPATLPQSDSGSRGISANELARRVVTNELKSQDEDHGHWMYRLEKRESEKKQVQEIVQTKYGSLSQLVSINGRLLDITGKTIRAGRLRLFPGRQGQVVAVVGIAHETLDLTEHGGVMRRECFLDGHRLTPRLDG